MRQIILKAFFQKSIIMSPVICMLMAVPVLSQYEISWYTINGGGGQGSGGQYTLTGTIGQPDAANSAGEQYEVLGGFWPGGLVCIPDIVNFYDFAKLAEHWLETPCNELNNWCSGADLDQLGEVDTVDLKLFVEEWLFYRCSYNWPLR
jgi:hypothetical protein